MLLDLLEGEDEFAFSGIGIGAVFEADVELGDDVFPDGCGDGVFPGGIAVLGGDGNNDTAPSDVEGVGFPVHVLAVNALGLHLLDYLRFTDLAAACAEVERRERPLLEYCREDDFSLEEYIKLRQVAHAQILE